MLNSLAKFDAKYHGGSVQNIKFSPSMFNENRAVIKSLFKTYFAKGGCHLMVTVVDKGVLEDAVEHPENYPDLIVRVSGFSAVFVDLSPNIQQELLSRVLYRLARIGYQSWRSNGSPFTTARASGPSFSFKVVPYIVHGAPTRNPRKGNRICSISRINVSDADVARRFVHGEISPSKIIIRYLIGRLVWRARLASGYASY